MATPYSEADLVAAIRTTLEEANPPLSDKAARIVSTLALSANSRTRLIRYLSTHVKVFESGDPHMPRVAQRLLRAAMGVGVTVTLPQCQQCSRERLLTKTLPDGKRVCARCEAQSQQRVCNVCQESRSIHTSGPDGTVCKTCWRRDPRSRKVCIRCRQPGIIERRTHEGPVCSRCAPGTIATCISCHQTRSITGYLLGGAQCNHCYNVIRSKAAPCPGCGDTRILAYGNSPSEAVCASCANVPPRFACQDCHGEVDLLGRKCARCVIRERSIALITGPDGVVNDTFLPVQKMLCQTERPVARANWFHRSKAAGLLRDMVNGRMQLSHDSLDQDRSSASEYVRCILVETSLLPVRSEVLSRAERAIATTITAQQPELQRQLTSYAMWSLLRDLRKREHLVHLTQGHQMRAQRAARAAAVLLSLKKGQSQSITQETLDDFLAQHPRYRLDVLKFLRWQSRTTSAEPLAIWLPSPKLPTVTMNADSLRAQVERLSTNSSLPTRLRVAGLCVALFGQTLTKLVRLTTEHHIVTDQGDQLLLGATPVTLPPILKSLLNELRAQPTRWAYGTDTMQWLFPSIYPGVPMSAKALGEQLRRHGVLASTLRAAALHNLANHIPVGVLTEVTGLGSQAAIRWAEVSGRSWSEYVGLRATSRNSRQ